MQKLFSGGAKEWLLIVLGAAVLLAALLLPLRHALAEDLTAEEQQLADAYHQGELIRIHIIANSDSFEDQTLKLKVRDAILESFGEALKEKEVSGFESVYAFLQHHTEQMRAVAQACCIQNGFPGRVTAETGLLSLPSKRYGNVILPEDEYRALRITLGEGKGQNWWCVLYPQLCLALSTTEAADDHHQRWFSGRIFANWLLLER